MTTTQKIIDKYTEWSEKIITDDFRELITKIIAEVQKSEDANENLILINYLANALPSVLISMITDKNFDSLLDFNHFANEIIFKINDINKQ